MKPNSENIEKLKRYSEQKQNSNKGGMSCAALPIEKVIEVSKEALSRSSRYEVNYGLMLQVGVFTGLRYVDLVRLRKFNLIVENGGYILEGKTVKTDTPFKKPISDHLANLLFDNANEGEQSLLMHNNGSKWQHGWLSRKIQKSFDKDFIKAKQDSLRKEERITIGAHSLRKTYGMHIYNQSGINAARIALQHKSLATTSRYLGVNMEEQIEVEKEAFKGLW